MATAILGVLASLGPWGSAVASYLGYQKQKDTELNDPAHVAAAVGQGDQVLEEKLEGDLTAAKKNPAALSQVRKDAA